MTDKPQVDVGPKAISRRDFLKLAGLGFGTLAARPLERALERNQSKDLLELKQRYIDYGGALQLKINRRERLSRLGGQEAIGLSLFFNEVAKKARENGLSLDDVALIDWTTIALAAAGTGMEIAGWTWQLIDKKKADKLGREGIVEDENGGDAESVSRKDKFVRSLTSSKNWQNRLKIGGFICLGIAGGRIQKTNEGKATEIIWEDTGSERVNVKIGALGYLDSPTGWQDLQTAANLSNVGEAEVVSPDMFIKRQLYVMHQAVSDIYNLNQQIYRKIEKDGNREQAIKELIPESSQYLQNKFLTWSWSGQDLSEEEIINLLIKDEELRRQFRAYVPNEQDNPFKIESNK